MPEEASLTYDPLTDENGYLVSDHEQAWLDTNQNSLTNNQTAKGKEKEEMPEASFFDDAFFEPSLERDLSSEKPQDMQASYGLADPSCAAPWRPGKQTGERATTSEQMMIMIDICTITLVLRTRQEFSWWMT